MCLTDQTKKELKKAGPLFFTLSLFQSTIRSHFSVLPIFTPFRFSVFSLCSRSFKLRPGSAVGENAGKKLASEANRT